VGLVDLADHLVQRRFGDVRVAAVAQQHAAVALQFLEDVRLQVGARGHVHDLEDGDQREMVVHGLVAWHQQRQPLEQVLKPQHGANALVERVFVQDQGGASRRWDAASIVSQPGNRRHTEEAERPQSVDLGGQFGQVQAVVDDDGIGGGPPWRLACCRITCSTWAGPAGAGLDPRLCVASLQSTTSTRST
jgi:hypothetical protein